jgi:hypothetical protein
MTIPKRGCALRWYLALVIVAGSVLLQGCSPTTTRQASQGRTATTSPKSFDPTELHRLDDEAAANDRSGQARSAVPSGTPARWLIGSVGTYAVGRGAPPGTYRTGISPSGTCSWARLRGGRPGDVIAGGSGPGPISVVIKSTDEFFTTNGCANWQRTR